MSDLRMLNLRNAEPAEGPDAPVSGGIGAVLARGAAAKLARAELDTQLLAATDDELDALALELCVSVERLTRRRDQLNSAITLSMLGAL